jgi:enoyl-[acyl-carrier protein] reductase I
VSLLEGKKGLIVGVANDHSIAWGIAAAASKFGADLAFTYQTASFERRVRPLAESVGAKIILPCDVVDDASLDSVFSKLSKVGIHRFRCSFSCLFR